MADFQSRPKAGERFNSYKQLRQINIPLGMVESGRFSPTALIVYGRLQYHKGKDGDSCWVFRDTLAKELKTTMTKLDRAINELKSGGVLRTERHGRGTENEYVFLYSPLFDDSARVQTQDVHLTQVETSQNGTSDSAPVRSQESPDSALVTTQGASDSSPVLSQKNPEFAKTPPLSSQNSASEFAKLALAYKDEKKFKRSLKESSSSGSSATGAEEEDDDSLSQKTEAETDTPPPGVIAAAPVEHSDEDVLEFGEHMRDSIVFDGSAIEQAAHRFIGKEKPVPRPEFVREVLSCAPTWTSDEIWTALKINRDEKISKPRTYSWFKTTVADVYERWKGIPPALPARIEPQSIYKLTEGPEGPSPELTQMEKVQRCRYQQQSERWQQIYSQHRKAGTANYLDISETGMRFHLGSSDERDAILDQLEAGVPFDQVVLTPETAEAPSSEQRVAS